MTDLGAIQRLYDENRFLEAYRRTADYWNESQDLTRFSSNELILGGRLALKLGGWRLSRWIFRTARERDPSNPRVRCFTEHLPRRDYSLLDYLRRIDKKPELETNDRELQSSWLASNAVLWASLRDFERAHASIKRAGQLYCEDGWVASCESDVLGLEDRWEEALDCAETSWERSRGAPYAARSLGSTLLNLGRVREAADRVGQAAETTEAYDIAYLASWYYGALADTLEGEARRSSVERARCLAKRLPELAPLADRESRRFFARMHLMLAELADDRDEMECWAREVHSPFCLEVLANLEKKPEGVRTRLPFRREMQKHMTCLPTSLSSALATMDEHVDADAMAAELTFGGTETWAAAEWLERLGYAVRFFVVTPKLASDLIRNGIAFVLSLEADDFAHAVAIVGLDEAAGTLLVHDPQQFLTNEYLLEPLGKDNPLGPRGMVAVPAAKRALLDGILSPEDVEVMSASREYQRALRNHGTTFAGAVLAELRTRYPSHPETVRLEAIQADEEGRTSDSLAGFRKLLNSFPGNPSARAGLIRASRSLENTALLRDILEGVVERGLLPGVNVEQEWRRPPSGYVAQYADLLRISAATVDRARSMLLAVLRRESSSASTWHVLGDLTWNEGETDDALLCYRLASCLEDNNEHYAHAYADALAIGGRVDNGIAWLENRVERFRSSSRAVSTWTTWIGALEAWGYPEGALAATEDALRSHEDSAELLAYVVPFFARMGRWDEAESLLRRLENAGHPGLFHDAAVDFHRMRGELDESIRHAEALVRELPQNVRARSMLLDLLLARDGFDASIERARSWIDEQPGHEGLEELYSAQLDHPMGSSRRKALLLRRRVKRNPEDAWTWRELAFTYVREYETGNERRCERLAPRIRTLVRDSERTAPTAAATFRVKAAWAEATGDWKAATEYWIESIERDPGTAYGYRRAWECSSRFDHEGRLEVWKRLESLLLGYPGHLSGARELTPLAAQRLGVGFAESAVTRWKELRPDDPEVTESLCDLLLDYGHGRSDSERALSMLLPAVERFPFHLRMRFSLLRAYRALERLPEAEEVVREVIRRHPGSSAGRIQLAWIHELAGRDGQARRLLEEGIRKDPQSTDFPAVLVEMHTRNGRFEEAQALVNETLTRLPSDISWMERSIQHFLQMGRAEEAVRVARYGVERFPRGAHLWFLLGETLDAAGQFAAPGEVVEYLSRSLELNPSHFEAADWLAVVLVGQRQYARAESVLRNIASRLSDPCPAFGRLAWVHREQGQRAEALEELESVVRASPWYQWGWGLLMEWLTEDEAWAKARSLLGTTPEEIRTDLPLLRERLKVLEKANVGKVEVDAEWDRLLADFSENVSLHLDRFDTLHAAKRFPEAATVLRRAHSRAAEDPYVNARLVEVLARESNGSEALEALRRVVFAPVEESEWPAGYAWDRARGAGFGDQAFEMVKSALYEGAQPTPHALTLWSYYALEQTNPEVQAPQSRWRTWFPDTGAREVSALVNDRERFPWMGGRYLAAAFAAWIDHGYGELVRRYWRANRAEIQADAGLWAQTSRALIQLGRKREARELLADWRERPGASMWMVTNYVNSFSALKKSHLEVVRSESTEALHRLPHDHCARYLAHLRAEACALLDDRSGFLETWAEHRPYFDGDASKEDYFSDERTHLLGYVPRLATLLEDGKTWEYRKSLWHLRWLHLRSFAAQPLKRLASIFWWVLGLLVIRALLR